MDGAPGNRGFCMQFHALLQDDRSQVFLIHCTAESAELQVALLVVDGFIGDGWLTVKDPTMDGVAYLVQLPTEVIAQPERYKGYDCVLPLKRIT